MADTTVSVQTLGLKRFAPVSVGAMLCAALLCGGSVAQAQDCPGTKVPFRGQCMYQSAIDDILKREAAAAAEKARAEKAARERAEKERLAAADNAACQSARQAADPKAAWTTYLKEHSGGKCASEARQVINRTPVIDVPKVNEDQKACEQAKAADDKASWDSYLAKFPQGACAALARKRLEELGPPLPGGDTTGEGGIHPLVWVGAAVGGAGLITFAVAGGVTLGRKSSLGDACQDSTCPPDKQADLDAANLSADVTLVGGLVTGAGAVLAAIGIIMSVSGGDSPASDTTAAVYPSFGLGSVGIAGRF